jgi:hypothetical protein
MVIRSALEGVGIEFAENGGGPGGGGCESRNRGEVVGMIRFTIIRDGDKEFLVRVKFREFGWIFHAR